MDLFEAHRRELLRRRAPLADRMRPRTLDELVGQERLIGPGTLLRQAIEQDRLSSLILWGPPGSGKTTLARVVAGITQAHFVQLSAVMAGVADLRREIAEARDRLGMHGKRTILFIDEIHRFNKAQQDAILPQVEDGTVTLIGATTENPSFEVNSPLLSRSRVLVLEALGDEAIGQLLDRALVDSERGLGVEKLTLAPEARTALVNLANGDARFALNTLELAAVGAVERVIGVEQIAAAADVRGGSYDRAGEAHYDTISALHKSIRGSDPDAALYWLARMLERGDDPLYVARRLVRAASEDVGLADPQALAVTLAAQQAVHFLGLPEGKLALAEAVVYLATAPKSNTLYQAYDAAARDVQATRNDPVPLHLRNAPTRLMRELGYGRDYRYAHDYQDALVEQQHLPDNLVGRVYYEPSSRGYEREIGDRLRRWRELLARRRTERTTRQTKEE
ncbi:MAG TPA: replication-associated recombination protein A [Thermomicrobiaceae bacterium]|nr:replication-associated recombination protein A [Thermomicrobiaceae bacterium]